MGRSLARKMADMKAKAAGREPMRVIFKLHPTCVERVPKDVENLVFMWQRGAKLQVTKVMPVDPSTRMALFEKEEVLQQSTTMYKEGDSWLPKEYKLKLESVTPTKTGQDKTRTISRFSIDFAVFGHLAASGESEDIEVNMKPSGVLRARVSVVWLKNFDHNSAPSEASFATGVQSMASYQGYGGGGVNISSRGDADQDLSGFDMMSPGHRARGSGAARRPEAIREDDEGGRRGGDSLYGDDIGGSGRAVPSSLGGPSVPAGMSTPNPPSGSASPGGAHSAAASGGGKGGHRRGWSLFAGSKGGAGAGGAGGGKGDDKFFVVDSEAEVRYIDGTTDVTALRKKAKDLVYQRDRKYQEYQTLCLQNRASSEPHSPLHGGGLGDPPPEFVDQLVQAKLRLAQAEYHILELNQALMRERQRSKSLMAKATNLAAQRDLLLNKD